MTSRPQQAIGVLALQGAFALHRPHIEALGSTYVAVTEPGHLAQLDALILPGGESGAMLKLLANNGLTEPLGAFLRLKPVWGLCAGAILMAKTVRSPAQASFAALDIEIERNAYGRQLASIQASVLGYDVSYIRAPSIGAVGPAVRVLAVREEQPVWVEQGRLIATTFHPELNPEAPSPWHRRLAELAAH